KKASARKKGLAAAPPEPGTVAGPTPSGATADTNAVFNGVAMDVTHSLTTPVPQEVSDQEIQMRAYLRWEAAGKPRGNDFRFWVEAREDLQREKGALETIRQRA